VTLSAQIEAEMIAHARRTAPSECCGLLVGTPDEVLEAVAARNLAEDPAKRYLVDPHDHLRAIRSARQRGLQVIGAYHSHPRSAARPSPTDAADAFSHFVFVIVGLGQDPPEVTAWTWSDGNFVPMPLVRFPKGKG
jgi:proteasome lid subunit RPN8/RPN11